MTDHRIKMGLADIPRNVYWGIARKAKEIAKSVRVMR